MKIIRDGNLTSWINSLLILTGANIGLYAIETFPNNSMAQLLIGTLGIAIAGVGGHSAQAHTLKSKPFGNLTFPPNKPGEKTPPESSLEKITSWVFFGGTALSIYLWLSY